MGTFDSFNIGKQALLAQQSALQTAGHNIANVNTPSFSRQRVEFEAVTPHVTPRGAIGRGVGVVTVAQIKNDFIEDRLRSADGNSATLDINQDTYQQIESIYNELSENDFSTKFDNFFSALSDLSMNVEDPSTASVLLESAKTLSETINNMDSLMSNLRNQLNDDVQVAVGEINRLTKQIATLNREIVRTEAGGATGISANDLRDSRTKTMRDLATLTDSTFNEMSNGAISVTLNGQLLVFNDDSFDLDIKTSAINNRLSYQPVMAADGSPVRVNEGKLAGIVQSRDTIIPGYLDELDEIAATMIFECNKVQATGSGLIGLSTATAQNALTDSATALNLANFTFNPVGNTFQMQNGSFKINVVNKVTGEVETSIIDVDLDGINPPTPFATADTTLDSLATDISTTTNITATVNARNELVITSDSPSYTFYFTEDSSDVLASLGVNSMFDGYNSRTMEVGSDVQADTRLLSTGLSTDDGDNTNILRMLALRDEEIMSNDSRSIEDYYQTSVGRMANETARTTGLKMTADDVQSWLSNEREQVSGVSLDEEMANLVQYQRSYQSAAKFVSTVDTIIETLLNI